MSRRGEPRSKAYWPETFRRFEALAQQAGARSGDKKNTPHGPVYRAWGQLVDETLELRWFGLYGIIVDEEMVVQTILFADVTEDVAKARLLDEAMWIYGLMQERDMLAEGFWNAAPH